MGLRWLALVGLLALSAACRQSSNRRVYVDLPSADHLKEGSPVTFGGIDIGHVQRLTLLHVGVRVELVIERSDAPLHADDLVAVRPVGVFGDEALVIMPRAANDRALRDQDTLRAAPSDSLGPIRQALTQALMSELGERLRLTDSTKGSSPDSHNPR